METQHPTDLPPPTIDRKAQTLVLRRHNSNGASIFIEAARVEGETAQPLAREFSPSPTKVLGGLACMLTSPGEQPHEIIRHPKHSPSDRDQINDAEPLHNNDAPIVATPEQQATLVEFWSGFESFCRSLTRQHGEDIAQTVRLAFLARVPPSVDEPEKVRAWLCTSARREAIRLLQPTTRVYPVAPEDIPDLPSNQDEGVEVNIKRSEVKRENAQVIEVLSRLLEPGQWLLIERLYINGEDEAALAAEWGLSLRALAGRKFRVWKTIEKIAMQQDGRKTKGYYRNREKLPITDLLRELLAIKKAEADSSKS